MILAQREYHELQWNELTPDVFAAVFSESTSERPKTSGPLTSE